MSFAVKDIDPKPWSGHFNYRIRVRGKTFILRFKGPEWGEATRGIKDQYEILRYVERYRVAPRAYGLFEDFFWRIGTPRGVS